MSVLKTHSAIPHTLCNVSWLRITGGPSQATIAPAVTQASAPLISNTFCAMKKVIYALTSVMAVCTNTSISLTGRLAVRSQRTVIRPKATPTNTEPIQDSTTNNSRLPKV